MISRANAQDQAYSSSIDSDLGATTDVEGIGVVSATTVAILVVDRDLVQLKVCGTVDREDLNGRVLDGDASYDTVRQGMSVEELQLRQRGGPTGSTMSLPTLGFVLPPLVPSPSHQRAPPPSRTLPEAPVTVMSVPETETRGPDHSL